MTRNPTRPPKLSATMLRRIARVSRAAFEVRRARFVARRYATIELLRSRPYRLPEFQIAQLLGVSVNLLARDYPKGGRDV